MYFRIIFLFLVLLSSMTCEGLNRDIVFNSHENYWEHHGYFCKDCLKQFGFFQRTTNWNELESYVGLIPQSKSKFCDKCLTFGGKKKEGIFAPYFVSEDYFDFLQDHLIYCKDNPPCKCYWPEINISSAKISDISFELFSNLFGSTALIQVVNNGEKQREMLLATPTNANRFSLHGLMVALLSKSFFYSHYYRICKDIDRYSKHTFNDHKYAIIQQKLEGIIITIGEKYLKLYELCLKKHPSRRISLEYDFIKNELNSYDQNAFSTNYNILKDDLTPDSIFKTEECFYREEETFALDEEWLKNIDPLIIKLKNGKFHQMGWLESEVLLQQGTLLNHLLLYKDSVEILSKAIKLNPSNVDAYIERAFAYFETNQISLALEDYKNAKKLIAAELFDIGIKGLYSPENKAEFTKGLLSGTIAGAKISTVEFVPSLFSSCRGILNGLWAFACSPIEVSNEMSATAYAIGEFVSRNSAHECLQCVVPELKELSLLWDNLNDHSRGEKIGFLIGRYGVDIFSPIAILKGVNKIKALRRANTTLTLESCISQEKQAKILEESVKRATLRATIIAESVKEGKILVKSSNVAPHVMQSKHAWDKVLNLSGNIEEDFKKVLAFLEDKNIMDSNNLKRTIALPKDAPVKNIHILEYRVTIEGQKIQASFEKYLDTGEIFLKNGWVVTN